MLTLLEYSHCRCPTSHVPHTTDTVPSSATFKALSEAGMHVLCDTLHVTSLYIRCTSVCVCGLTDFVTSDSSLSVLLWLCNRFLWWRLERGAKEIYSQRFVSMALNGCEYANTVTSTAIVRTCPTSLIASSFPPPYSSPSLCPLILLPSSPPPLSPLPSSSPLVSTEQVLSSPGGPDTEGVWMGHALSSHHRALLPPRQIQVLSSCQESHTFLTAITRKCLLFHNVYLLYIHIVCFNI